MSSQLQEKLQKLILKYTKDNLEKQQQFHLLDKLAAYHSGYMKNQRREIETRMFKGDLKLIIATNGLELGIDIGTLDCVVLVGFPGKISSFLQQIGRVGRGGRNSLSIMVCQNSPIDKYFLKNCSELTHIHKIENVKLNPHNSFILKRHLFCASLEAPFILEQGGNVVDFFFKNDQIMNMIMQLYSTNEFRIVGKYNLENNQYAQELRKELNLDFDILNSFDFSPNITEIQFLRFPMEYLKFNIRTMDDISITLYDNDNKELCESAYDRALFELYPGAIYLHQGVIHLVTKLCPETNRAECHRSKAHYHTSAIDNFKIQVLKTLSSKQLTTEIIAYYGEIEVTRSVEGYDKIRFGERALLGENRVHSLPPIQRQVYAIWIEFNKSLLDKYKERNFPIGAAFHTIGHLLRNFIPIKVLCDKRDINIHHLSAEGNNLNRITIFEIHPGDVGIAEDCFYHIEELLKESLKLVSSCDCSTGCNGCIFDSDCGSGNRQLDKQNSITMLENITRDLLAKPQINLRNDVISRTSDIK